MWSKGAGSGKLIPRPIMDSIPESCSNGSSHLKNKDRASRVSATDQKGGKRTEESAASADDDREDTWSTTPSNGTPTDEDVGDVWDEETSFVEDEVEGFEDDPPATGKNNLPDAPETNINVWNLEDIPEEEAELLGVFTAAEEYLSSAASGGQDRLHHSPNTSYPRNHNNPAASRPSSNLNAEEPATVGASPLTQRKQNGPENSTANNPQWKCAATASLTLPNSKQADDREDISIDMSSHNKRQYATGGPHLSVFTVADTKFPDSPTNSRRETISSASQSPIRSLRSHNQSKTALIGQFKVSKSIKAAQIDQTDQTKSKFRRSPPPPIPDFRPGSPPDDEFPDDQSNARRAIDPDCLSKLAVDIERLLAQLDKELPEEKTRCKAIIRDQERKDHAEYIIDTTDFRKCYCSVLAIDTTSLKQQSVVSSTFLSPSSDLSFYSGDEGEASLILDNSDRADLSISLGDRLIGDRDQSAVFEFRKREKADSLKLPAADRSRTSANVETTASNTALSQASRSINDQRSRNSLMDVSSKSERKTESEFSSKYDSSYQSTSSSFSSRDDSSDHNRFLSKYRFLKTDSALGYRFTPAAEKDGSTRFRYSSYASATTRLLSVASTRVSLPVRTNSRTFSEDSTSRYTSLEEDEEKKKLQERIRNLERILIDERDLRNSAEQSEQQLRKRMEQIERKLEQTEKNAAARTESDAAKHEQLLNQMRMETDRMRQTHQVALESLRKEHVVVVASIEDKLNGLRLEDRHKAENERARLRAQLNEAQTTADSLSEEKSNLETQRNQTELMAYEQQLKLEQLQGALTQAVDSRQKLHAENDKLQQEVCECKGQIGDIENKTTELQRQLDLITANLKEETDHRNALSQKVKHLEKENKSLRELTLQEEENKKDLNRQMNRANTENFSLQTKLEQCSLAQAELLEQQKNYYSNKLNQARQENDTLSSRITFLERIRSQLRQEIDDLSVDLKKADSTSSGYDKKVITLEKTVREWEQRYGELSGKVVALEGELRAATGELQRSGRQLQETLQECAALRNENKKLKEEVNQNQRRVYEITEELYDAEQVKKRLTEEKEELADVIEARSKETVIKAKRLEKIEAELSNVQEIADARVREEVEEYEEEKRGLQREVDELTARIETERLMKDTVIRQRELIQERMGELQQSLEEADDARIEALDRAKRVSDQNENLNDRLVQLQREHDSAVEKTALAEKRASVLQKEREEMAAALIQVERSRQELIEETMSLKQELEQQESSISELREAKDEVDAASTEAMSNLAHATDAAAAARAKAEAAETENAQLLEALNNERQRASRAEQLATKMEETAKELQSKMERLERTGLASSELAVTRLEQTIRELEADLKQERQKAHGAMRCERGSERIIKELQFQMEQERLQSSRMADAVENLERKLKMYKRQREEAEELANANIARCRELQQELDNVEGRADAAENVLSRIRAENRGRVSGFLTTTPVVTSEVISPATRRTMTTVLPRRHQLTSLSKSRLPPNIR